MSVRTVVFLVPLRAAVVRGSLAVFALLAACAPLAGPAVPAARRDRDWDYVVRNQGDSLEVTARFAPFSGALMVEEGAEPFVDRLEIDGVPASRAGSAWRAACGSGCTARYRFRLAEAARAVRDVDIAIEAGGALFAPPSTWLVRPSEARDGRYGFRVDSPPGVDFVTGVRPSASGGFEASIASFRESSFAGFGKLSPATIGDGALVVAVAPQMRLPRPALLEWASREVAAVDGYLGRGGDGRAVVFIVPGDPDGTSGETLGGGGASALIRLGQSVTERKLYDDWVLAHELVHVRFPAVQRRHAWFSEGLATYVEPIARVRAGLLTEKTLWREVVQGMPQGLPQPGDGGLDDNRAWGRVYWGGALYFLLADLEIRRRTGVHSLQTALGAVVAAGGNAETQWPLERILQLADGATGVPVLRELYERMGRASTPEDLPRLWRALGLVPDGEGIRFDDGAPDASLRRAITRAKSPPAAPRPVSNQATNLRKIQKMSNLVTEGVMLAYSRETEPARRPQ